MDDAAVFYLASLPIEGYRLLEKVFRLYSDGMLKGQKTKKISLGKPLELKGKFGTHNDIIYIVYVYMYILQLYSKHLQEHERTES